MAQVSQVAFCRMLKILTFSSSSHTLRRKESVFSFSNKSEFQTWTLLSPEVEKQQDLSSQYFGVMTKEISPLKCNKSNCQWNLFSSDFYTLRGISSAKIVCNEEPKKYSLKNRINLECQRFSSINLIKTMKIEQKFLGIFFPISLTQI